MYNLLKYEFYRLSKSKMVRVILIINFLWSAMQPFIFEKLMNMDSWPVMRYDSLGEEEMSYEDWKEESVLSAEDVDSVEDISVGITSMSSEKWLDIRFEPTVLDYFKTVISSMMPALLMVVFILSFIAGELNDGYIKSIGPFIKLSQIALVNIIIALVSAFTMFLSIIAGVSISAGILSGNFAFGSVLEFVEFFGYALLMMLSFCALPIALSYITRSTLVGKIIGIIEAILGNLIIARIANLVIKEYFNVSANFSLSKFFAVYNMKTSETAFGKIQLTNPVVFAIISLVVCTIVSVLALTKKDIK